MPEPHALPPLVTRVEPQPPAKPRPGLGEAVLWCVAFFATQLLAFILVTLIVLSVFAFQTPNPTQFLVDQLEGVGRAVTRTGPTEPPRPAMPSEIGQAFAWAMLAAQVASLILIWLVVPRRVGPDWKRQLGVRRPAAMHLLLIVLLVPGFIILTDGVQEMFVRLTGIKQPAATEALNGVFRNVPVLVTFLAVAFGPGLVEEVWCRGFLGRGLCARYGLPWGVVLTSLLFGMLHLDPSYLLITGLMGAYLHFVYIASRSIWVPLLLHMLNNGIAVFLTLNEELSALGESFRRDEQNLRAAMDVAAFSLLLFASVALWTSRAQVLPLRDTTANNELAGSEWHAEYPGVSAPPPGAPAKLGYAAISPAAVLLAMAAFGVLAFLLSKLRA